MITLETRADFTLENCCSVAWGGHAVSLGETARRAMRQTRADFLELIERSDVTIYGVSTGYGHHARKRLDGEGRKLHARQPTYHRAVSFGDPLPRRVTRAIVFARLANFIEGHAAISPSVAEAVAAMLDGSELPEVPARGQGGAGEILSLAPLFIGVAKPETLAEKDMISLVNGSPAATALVSDAALAAHRRLKLALEVFALAAEAFNSPLGHFAEELQGYWNNPHDSWALAGLRDLMGCGDGKPRRPYQAPVSIRIMPRVLGEARRAAVAAEEIARHSLMAVTDNPVVIPKGEQRGADPVISTGGFHNIQAAAAMDALTAAYANLAVLAGRIAAKLQDGSVSLLPPFLGLDDGLAYLGCLPMAIVGYEEEMRMLAQPSLLPGSESGGFGQDDVASPVFLAWTKVDRAGALLEQVLATMAPVAMRALTVTNHAVPENLVELANKVSELYPDQNGPENFAEGIARLSHAFRQRVYRP